MLEVANPYVVKISLALKSGDSILHISRKIGSSYGWTYRWIKELEKLGVVEIDKGVRVTDHELFDMFRELGKKILKKKLDITDAYLLPNFSGMKYAFTKTDAVFIWTKGGYQIGRSKSDYPIFINILREDMERWKDFFKEFHVDCWVQERAGEGIYFVLYPEKDFKAEWMDHTSVIPLSETVEWAEIYEINFQPALEMLDEIHDLELKTKYRERGREKV